MTQRTTLQHPVPVMQSSPVRAGPRARGKEKDPGSLGFARDDTGKTDDAKKKIRDSSLRSRMTQRKERPTFPNSSTGLEPVSRSRGRARQRSAALILGAGVTPAH